MSTILALLLMAGLCGASEFIVVYKDNVANPTDSIRAAETAILDQRLSLPRPVGTLPDFTIPFTLVKATSVTASPDGYVFPVKSATIRIAPNQDPDSVLATLLARPDVAGVYPNRIYRALDVALDCTPRILNGIVPRTYSIAWDRCLTPSSELIWTGRLCGQAVIQWTDVHAALKTTHAPVQGCRISLNAPGYELGTPNADQLFGRCGSAPKSALSLPTQLCAIPPKPVTTVARAPATKLSTEPLKQGEEKLKGMQRIQAVYNGRVFVNPLPSPIVVAVIDTGGSLLPDLNTMTGQSFVGGDWVDRVGHGTHVAGIIGARNNGQGVCGVLSGVPILPLKVLGDSGTGTMADTISALEYVATNAPSKKIGVINLSLGSEGTSADPVCAAI